MGTGDQGAGVGEERNRPSAPQPRPPAPQPRPSAGGLSTRGTVVVGVVVVLTLLVAFFAATIVAPFLHTRGVLQECDKRYGLGVGYLPVKKTVDRLGGQDHALERLSFYLRMPEWMAPDRPLAVLFLSGCGERAVPALIEALSDENLVCRFYAAAILGSLGPPAKDAIPALERALKDEREAVRHYAAEALKNIRGETPPGEPIP